MARYEDGGLRAVDIDGNLYGLSIERDAIETEHWGSPFRTYEPGLLRVTAYRLTGGVCMEAFPVTVTEVQEASLFKCKMVAHTMRGDIELKVMSRDPEPWGPVVSAKQPSAKHRPNDELVKKPKVNAPTGLRIINLDELPKSETKKSNDTR